MSDPTLRPLHTPLDSHEHSLAESMLALGDSDPSPELDARIRAQARAALRKRPFALWGASLAAVLALGVGVRVSLTPTELATPAAPADYAPVAPATKPAQTVPTEAPNNPEGSAGRSEEKPAGPSRAEAQRRPPLLAPDPVSTAPTAKSSESERGPAPAAGLEDLSEVARGNARRAGLDAASEPAADQPSASDQTELAVPAAPVVTAAPQMRVSPSPPEAFPAPPAPASLAIPSPPTQPARSPPPTAPPSVDEAEPSMRAHRGEQPKPRPAATPASAGVAGSATETHDFDKREPSKLEPSKREPSKLEPSKLEPSELESSKRDPNQRDPEQDASAREGAAEQASEQELDARRKARAFAPTPSSPPAAAAADDANANSSPPAQPMKAELTLGQLIQRARRAQAAGDADALRATLLRINRNYPAAELPADLQAMLNRELDR